MAKPRSGLVQFSPLKDWISVFSGLLRKKAITVRIPATKYVRRRAAKGLAFSGVDFWQILYRILLATIRAMEKTYINTEPLLYDHSYNISIWGIPSSR